MPRDAKRERPAALEAQVSTTELPGLSKVYNNLAVKGGELLLGTTVSKCETHVIHEKYHVLHGFRAGPCIGTP